MAKVIVCSGVWTRVNEYYNNVADKYPNTWNINDTIEQINKIQGVISNFESVCSWSRVPILPYWKRMNWKETWHKSCHWHFAFERNSENGEDCIFIRDTEHHDNIKECCYGNIRKIIGNKQNNTMNNTKKRIRLTESDLNRLIKESLNELGYSHWPLQDDERQLPKGYDDEWEEDNNFKDMFGPGRYGSPYYRTNDRLEHLNGYVPDDERRRDMRRDWEDQKFNDFQRLRYNSPWQGANPNVKTITDSDGDHIALNDYDAARRARGEHVPVRSSGPSAFDSPGRALYNEYMGVTESIRRAIIKVLR